MTLEQDVATLMAAQPRSERKDLLDGHSHPSSPLRANVVIPQTILPYDGSAVALATPTATAAVVGLVFVKAAIVANRISWIPLNAGHSTAVERFALYRADGQLKLFDVTDAVGASTGERSVTFDAVFLSPGNYYIFFCLASGTTSPDVIVYNTGTTFAGGPTSAEADVQGDLTVTGGAAPDTFDPTAIWSVSDEDKTLAFKLDGQ